jgi:hypothetical protein
LCCSASAAADAGTSAVAGAASASAWTSVSVVGCSVGSQRLPLAPGFSSFMPSASAPGLGANVAVAVSLL